MQEILSIEEIERLTKELPVAAAEKPKRPAPVHLTCRYCGMSVAIDYKHEVRAVYSGFAVFTKKPCVSPLGHAFIATKSGPKAAHVR